MKTLSKVTLGLYIVLTVVSLSLPLVGLSHQVWMTPAITLLASAFAVMHGSVLMGWKRVGLLLASTFGVSLAFESIGVMTGAVYGPYHYSDTLGIKFLDLVPLLIPAAWFMVMYPAFVIAERVLPGRLDGLKRYVGLPALAALVVTAWDLAMDPLMSAGGHWVWEVEGSYFGVPIQNFVGWWVTSFVSYLLYVLLSRGMERVYSPGEKYERLAVVSYLVIGGSNVLANLIYEMPGPALVGFFAMAPWVILGYYKVKS